MTLPRGVLVDANQRRELGILGRHPSGNRFVHDTPARVPAASEDLGRAQDVGLFHHVDGEALEGLGEPALGLGPWEVDLEYVVLGTLDPGRPGEHEGDEAAGVEVAPPALVGVVIEGELRPAGGTGPAPALAVGEEDPLCLPLRHGRPQRPRADDVRSRTGAPRRPAATLDAVSRLGRGTTGRSSGAAGGLLVQMRGCGFSGSCRTPVRRIRPLESQNNPSTVFCRRGVAA
jgi:hypothetical protein